MSAIALVARGLGKRYRTGLGRSRGHEFWALRDIGFTLGPGEAVGVLGRNGAGKSTLLKLLTRIASPSEGEFETWGRVCGLLEVGSGFHPELTGRENVFLNAALHGLDRRETARRLDAIVGFAGVEDFLDTPMKRYSTGMYVRLAFAVAAHLDADVLLVDEVLSVADAAFRARSLARLGELGRAGCALVFVSHDLEALRATCSRGLWLEAGRLSADAAVDAAIARYLLAGEASRYAPRPREGERPRIVLAELRDGHGRRSARIAATDAASVRVAYAVPRAWGPLRLAASVGGAGGARLFASDSRDAGIEVPCAAGEHALELRLPPGTLECGVFQVGLQLWDAGERLDGADPALHLEVVPGRGGETADPLRPRGGVRVPCEWSVALPEESLAE
jgi:ABC-type polysaccharide/polyol phosphate transport system ATPase subunit